MSGRATEAEPEWTGPLHNQKSYLWMYLMPGLTDAIFRKAAIDTGACKVVELGGRTIELWPKLNEVTGAQWGALKRRCSELLHRQKK